MERRSKEAKSLKDGRWGMKGGDCVSINCQHYAITTTNLPSQQPLPSGTAIVDTGLDSSILHLHSTTIVTWTPEVENGPPYTTSAAQRSLFSHQ